MTWESSVDSLTLHLLQVTALHQIQKQVLRWDDLPRWECSFPEHHDASSFGHRIGSNSSCHSNRSLWWNSRYETGGSLGWELIPMNFGWFPRRSLQLWMYESKIAMQNTSCWKDVGLVQNRFLANHLIYMIVVFFLEVLRGTLADWQLLPVLLLASSWYSQVAAKWWSLAIWWLPHRTSFRSGLKKEALSHRYG